MPGNVTPLRSWLELIQPDADPYFIADAWRGLSPPAIRDELATGIPRPEDELTPLYAGLARADVRRFLDRYYRAVSVDCTPILAAVQGMVAGALLLRALHIGDRVEAGRWLTPTVAGWNGGTADPAPLPAPPEGSGELAEDLDRCFRHWGVLGGAMDQTAAAACWAHALLSRIGDDEGRRGAGGSARRMLRRRDIPLLQYEPGRDGGITRLTVELIEPGLGGFYADPLAMPLVAVDEAFRSAVSAAWAAAEGQLGAERDVRWRVDGLAMSRTEVAVLRSGSHGAAVALALSQLLTGDPLDARLAVTATLEAGRRLGRVDGVREKVVALLAATPPAPGGVLRIAVHPANEHDAAGAVREARREAGCEILPVETLAHLRREATGTLHEWRRLLDGECRTILDASAEVLHRPFPDAGSLAAFCVPAQLARASSGESDILCEASTGVATDPVVTWDEVRTEFRRAVLLAPPGYGKSLLVGAEVALRCAAALERQTSVGSEPTRAAVLVKATELAAQLAMDEPADSSRAAGGILAGVWQVISDRHRLEDAFSPSLRAALARGHCLLAVDALDEVTPESHRIILLESLAEYARECPDSHLILTARREGYARTGAVSPAWELELLPFSEEEQWGQAIRSWYAGEPERAEALVRALQEETRLRYVLQVPLLLRIACQLAGTHPLTAGSRIPWTRRTDLYRAFIDEMLRRWAERPPQPDLTERSLFLPFASEFCERLILGSARDDARSGADLPPIEASELAELVNRLQVERFPQLGRRSLVDDLCRAGLLVRTGGDRLAVAHQTFAEFLAGWRLAQRAGREGWFAIEATVEQRLLLPEWQEPLVFLAGLLPDPVPYLRLLCETTRHDVLKHRLALAARCLPEVSHEQRPAVS